MALLALVAAILGNARAVAETALEEPPTAEVIHASLLHLDESADLDEVAKTKVRELYAQAIKELELARSWRAKVERFTQMVAVAPQELDQARADLAGMPPVPDFALLDASLTDLEQSLATKETELAERKAEAAELESELRRRAGRRIEMPKLASAAQERLAEVLRQLQAPLPAEVPAVAAARRADLLARREALEQELATYDRELRAYEVRSELISVRRDLATRRVAHLEQILLEWRARVNHQRYRETETQLRRARWEADRVHPAFEQLAETNARWTHRRKELAELIAVTTRELEQTNDRLAALQDQFDRTREKVDTVGLTNAIGLLLRKQREALPNDRNYWRRIGARQATIRDCQFELLQLKDRRSELANLDSQVEREMRSLGRDQGQADSTELKESVRSLLESERDYLDSLIIDVNSHFDRLVDLDNAERQLADRTHEYSTYINERVLWIRSATVLGPHEFGSLGEGLVWLVSPTNWLGLGHALTADLWGNPLIAASALAVFAALFIWRHRMRTKLSDIGDVAARSICCRIAPTLEAVALTLLSAVAWPGLLGFVAWRLGADASESEFIRAVSSGLWSVAGVYLALELLHQMFRENVLFDAHFDWPSSSLQILRRQCRWAMLLVLPLVFLTVAMNFQENERGAASLGRLSFVVALAICSLFVWRSLRAAGGVHKHILASGQGEWLIRLRLIWYPLAVALPLMLALMAVLGYYYTAQQLAQRMTATVYILLGLTLLRSFLLRWVLVRRRKLAIEQSRQRRAASQAEDKPSGESGIVASIPTTPEPHADLATINMQTRHMVEYSLAVTGVVGMWVIWIDVLPALGFLHRFELWHTVEQARATTLADLSLSLLILATTLIAAKNVPGLLEMLLLHHLPIDAGLRYTVGTVSRYLIIVIGAVLGCQSIGLAWVKVQWLVAAVSVGLGFGLQEIFANFVSGLIILFERPVRVGDVVTVADVTGVISKINMRATTITNWDRKEFIVPNKEFITGRLLNWTLSDQVNRLILQVGIAYGSDTELAAGLLVHAAEEHPRVLADPGPRATFEEFGDSSLKFVLRCYLPDLEDRLAVIHDLHMSIDRKFRDAGIEIAFPQHDIHVRSVDSALSLFSNDHAKPGTSGGPRVDSEDAALSRRVA